MGLTYLPVSRRVELGRALAKMGQKEAALQELEQAVTMEEEDINAHLQKVCRLSVCISLPLATQCSGTIQGCGCRQVPQIIAVVVSKAMHPTTYSPYNTEARLLSPLLGYKSSTGRKLNGFNLAQIDAEILLNQLRQSRRRFGGLQATPDQQLDMTDATGAATRVSTSLTPPQRAQEARVPLSAA